VRLVHRNNGGHFLLILIFLLPRQVITSDLVANCVCLMSRGVAHFIALPNNHTVGINTSPLPTIDSLSQDMSFLSTFWHFFSDRVGVGRSSQHPKLRIYHFTRHESLTYKRLQVVDTLAFTFLLRKSMWRLRAVYILLLKSGVAKITQRLTSRAKP
jgi:hypothetical protein